MSRVVIQGDASGTGNFTIAAPNSNTDRTLTLPDVSGTLVTGDDIAINGITSDYTSGTALNIDSSGRVTMPYQPMLSASRTTNFGSNNASQTLINYDTAQVNVGNHYNTTSGLFTCPVNGNYRVTAFGMNVGATVNGAFVYNAVSVRKNNSQIAATAYNYGDGYVHISGNWIISASAGDSISIFTASCLGNYGQLTIELIS